MKGGQQSKLGGRDVSTVRSVFTVSREIAFSNCRTDEKNFLLVSLWGVKHWDKEERFLEGGWQATSLADSF